MSANGNGEAISIILVHGYLGAPTDLAPLAEDLVRRHGQDSVHCLHLPGHQGDANPPFDEEGFLAFLKSAIDGELARGRRLVLIGHSTGGSLLLAEITRRLAADSSGLDDLLLLVLCATPPRIGLGYARRWDAHTMERAMAIDDTGAIVSLVNRLARRAPVAFRAPVLVVQGEEDELVPAEDAELWRKGRFLVMPRHVRVVGARHHIFAGNGAAFAIDAIGRAINDATRRHDAVIPDALLDLVPWLEGFRAAWPDSIRHIRNSPAGLRAVGGEFVPSDEIDSEPTQANIEITTRCTLGCPACARTRLKLQSRFMRRDDFLRVLERLPHACRIVLVGLGEPLLHPELIDFIRLAVAEGRRVGLVTNAMNLDAEMARSLCSSGLAGITFSLDAVVQSTADQVRPGSDMQRISANIRNLIDERNRQGVSLATAAFTALSVDTIGEFGAIVDFVADHEIDAMMVTDLNFSANQSRSVHGAFSPEHARTLRTALKRAIRRRVPVLSVLGLEEFGLETRYMDYLLLHGKQLAHRSRRRTNCLSPWQTIPVSVDGHLSLCDCQPDAVIGNIHDMPLGDWWNGERMREQRRRMLGENPPDACRSCPRF